LMKIPYTDGKEDREERSFYYEYRKNHKIPGEKPV